MESSSPEQLSKNGIENQSSSIQPNRNSYPFNSTPSIPYQPTKLYSVIPPIPYGAYVPRRTQVHDLTLDSEKNNDNQQSVTEETNGERYESQNKEEESGFSIPNSDDEVYLSETESNNSQAASVDSHKIVPTMTLNSNISTSVNPESSHDVDRSDAHDTNGNGTKKKKKKRDKDSNHEPNKKKQRTKNKKKKQRTKNNDNESTSSSSQPKKKKKVSEALNDNTQKTRSSDNNNNNNSSQNKVNVIIPVKSGSSKLPSPVTTAKRFEVGTIFENRKELSQCGLHRPPMAGIWGNSAGGCHSIVMSGGYEDDVDDGDVVIYTGQGGMEDGKQIADQVLDRGNASLAISCDTKVPVIVIRGFRLHSEYAPIEGYRYDGLYNVVKSWSERGKAGFLVWRFKLVRMAGQPPLPPPRPLKGPKKAFKFKVGTKEKDFVDNKVKKMLKSRKKKKDELDEMVDQSESEREMRNTRRKRKKSVRDPLRMNIHEVDEQIESQIEDIIEKPQICYMCRKKVGATLMSAHLEEHKKTMSNIFTKDERMKMEMRSWINQARIRSVLESIEDSITHQSENIDAFFNMFSDSPDVSVT